jgi:hypothetical protein
MTWQDPQRTLNLALVLKHDPQALVDQMTDICSNCGYSYGRHAHIGNWCPAEGETGELDSWLPMLEDVFTKETL